MRTVSKLLGTVALALAEEDGNGKSSGTRGNVHGCPASEVQTAHLVRPAKADVPCPVSDGAVDDGDKGKGEDQDGPETSTISEGTACDDNGDASEHHLVDAVKELRNSSSAGGCIDVDAHQSEVVQVLHDDEKQFKLKYEE